MEDEAKQQILTVDEMAPEERFYSSLMVRDILQMKNICKNANPVHIILFPSVFPLGVTAEGGVTPSK